MGLFSKKERSNSASSSPKLSPKLDSPTSRSSAMNSPLTPSFPPRPAVQLPPAPSPTSDPEGYLTSLQAVRERSQLVFEKVRLGRGKCFTLDPARLDDVISYVVGIIKVHSCSGESVLTGREIMRPRTRASHLMDVGNISMLEEDNDSNSSFRRGAIFRLRNVRVGCWICSLYRSFLMPVQGLSGNSPRNRIKSMAGAKVLLSQVWTCLKRECLAATSRIRTESIVFLLVLCD